jgi:hypothetical protein
MAQGQRRDLVVIGRERSGLYDLVQRLGELSGVEVRVDSRWKERRQTREARAEERRRGDRRVLDVDDQLRKDGWVFVPAADRS